LFYFVKMTSPEGQPTREYQLTEADKNVIKALVKYYQDGSHPELLEYEKTELNLLKESGLDERYMTILDEFLTRLDNE